MKEYRITITENTQTNPTASHTRLIQDECLADALQRASALYKAINRFTDEITIKVTEIK